MNTRLNLTQRAHASATDVAHEALQDIENMFVNAVLAEADLDPDMCRADFVDVVVAAFRRGLHEICEGF